MLLIDIRDLSQNSSFVNSGSQIHNSNSEMNLDIWVTPRDIDLDNEFEDDIRIFGHIDKVGNQLNIFLNLETKLSLTCDYTLEKFKELVSKEIKIICKVDNLNAEDRKYYSEMDNFILYNLDDREIDITQIVREELILTIPMKKVSPAYKDKSFSDIYPEFSEDKQPTIEQKTNPFDVLKNMKFTN